MLVGPRYFWKLSQKAAWSEMLKERSLSVTILTVGRRSEVSKFVNNVEPIAYGQRPVSTDLQTAMLDFTLRR